VAPRACVRVYARVLVPPNLYIHTYIGPKAGVPGVVVFFPDGYLGLPITPAIGLTRKTDFNFFLDFYLCLCLCDRLRQ